MKTKGQKWTDELKKGRKAPLMWLVCPLDTADPRNHEGRKEGTHILKEDVLKEEIL
jgi:hypothetical protein